MCVSVFVSVRGRVCGHGDGGVFRELVDPPWLPLPTAPCPTHWTTTEREERKTVRLVENRSETELKVYSILIN